MTKATTYNPLDKSLNIPFKPGAIILYLDSLLKPNVQDMSCTMNCEELDVMY